MKGYAVAIVDLQNYGFSTKNVVVFTSSDEAERYLIDCFREEARKYNYTEREIENTLNGKTIYSANEGELNFGGSYACIANYWYIDMFDVTIGENREYNIYEPHYLAENKYLVGEINENNAPKLINAYYEYRGSEEYEALFDLADTEEFNYFVNLYGLETTIECSRVCRFWIGGLNYYADKADRSGARCCEIMGIKDIVAFAKQVITDEAVSLASDYISGYEDYNTKLSICEHITECLDGVFDYVGYFGLAKRNGIKVLTDTYDLKIGDLNLDIKYKNRLYAHYGKGYKDIIIHFTDGKAMTDDNFVVISYPTIAELDNDNTTDWKSFDVTNKGCINFYDIQANRPTKTFVKCDNFRPIIIQRELAVKLVAMYVFPTIHRNVDFDGFWGESGFVEKGADLFMHFAEGYDISYFESNSTTDLVDDFIRITIEELSCITNPYAEYICDNGYLD